MKQLSLDEIKHKAEEIGQASFGHIHTLRPGCIFSEFKDKHAILVEDSGSGEAFVYYSDSPIEELARPLAILLNGSDTVPDKNQMSKERPATPAVAEMLLLMGQGRGHPHVLGPSCALNETPGKWRIVFEDNQTGEVLTSMHDERPLQDIRAIEAVIYA